MSADDGPPPAAPGTEVAPGYRLIAHLSRGRALDVHDAWSEVRGTRCVVKMLRPDRGGEPRRRPPAGGGGAAASAGSRTPTSCAATRSWTAPGPWW